MSRYGKKGLVDKWKPDRTFFIGLFVVVAVVVSLLIVFRPRKPEDILPIQKNDITVIMLTHNHLNPKADEPFTHTNLQVDDAESISEILSILEQYRYRRMSPFDGVKGNGSGMSVRSNISICLFGESASTELLVYGDTDQVYADSNSTHYRILGGEERLYDQLYKLIFPE